MSLRFVCNRNARAAWSLTAALRCVSRSSFVSASSTSCPTSRKERAVLINCAFHQVETAVSVAFPRGSGPKVSFASKAWPSRLSKRRSSSSFSQVSFCIANCLTNAGDTCCCCHSSCSKVGKTKCSLSAALTPQILYRAFLSVRRKHQAL